MANLSDFLNKKNSTRNLSDKDFEDIIDDLADQLCLIDIESQYTLQELQQDWAKLKTWQSTETYINSTSRLGMKLCEHFFPNFYDIQDKSGKSFRNQWTKDNIKKILRWNRRSHTTPYLSELKRGVYFCCGMTKNTMFRPQMAKLVCDRYQPSIVLDPCAGWGGRMLGAVASGANYIAFEPNTITYANLKNMIAFLEIGDKVTIICDDAMNMKNHNLPKVDLTITSPPYFDLEVYCQEQSQSITSHDSYNSWSENFLNGIIQNCLDHLMDGGKSCWNVGKVGKHDMNIDVQKYHQSNGFEFERQFSVVSSKRQSNQNITKNSKNTDDTKIFSKR